MTKVEHEPVKLSAKILFFGSLDEDFALEKALLFSNLDRKELLKEVHSSLLKVQKSQKSQQLNVIRGYFSFKEGIDLSYWREFKNNTDQDYFFPLLYKWIGGFEDRELEELFRISRGSLFARYNRGLLELGKYLVRA